MSHHHSIPVPGIEPVDGWELRAFDDDDGDGFTRTLYVACGHGREIILSVSRFFFTPTQARFAWIVRNNFPVGSIGARGALGPLTDECIDGGIAAEQAAATLKAASAKLKRHQPAFDTACAAIAVAGGVVSLGILVGGLS